MSLTNFDKIFIVEDSEYGYAASSFTPGKSTAPMYVPKLMGNISGTGPDKVNATKMFDNAKACKINYAKKVNRTKGFSPIVQKGCIWMDKMTPSGKVKKGSQFIIRFLNGNIASPYVTNR